jgi:hypothetical protein
MNWFLWLFLSVAIADGVARILSIGKKREPTFPAGVAVDLVVNGLLVWGVLYYGMRP